MNVSFQKDIAPLFTDGDNHCMTAQGVRLREYIYMSDAAGDETFPDHANANHVLARLTGEEVPRMPLGKPPWSESQIALFKSWMQTYLP